VSEALFQQALRDSVDEVLEKMFFVEALGESPDSASAEGEPPAAVAVELTFDGDPPGSLTLWVTSAAARPIAADFLGCDEEAVSDRQMEEVVCELANMICGSLLSRVESATTFHLAAPRIVPPAASRATGRDTSFCAVDLSNGTLTVAVTTGTPTCPEPAQSAS
jgi:CheY-specific phosphatase CheX